MAAASSPPQARWQVWIDRGGTFTDVVARRPDGSLVTHKLLSENPGHYEDAVLQGIRDVVGLGADEPLPKGMIEAVKMGTTVATNALIERVGERTVLAVTRGFADALRIGYQNRPHIFARRIVLPELLYERVVEIDERATAEGEELEPVDEAAVRRDLKAAFDAGIRSVAIVLMHGYRYSDHEARVAAIAAEIGFTQISASHRVIPLMKLVSRGDTTVVDAYLTPILARYIDTVAAEVQGTRLMFMQSNGGLADARVFRGKDSVLSGPAGGVVGAVKVAQMAGFEKLITFDMGGTSTDVAHYDGEYERAFETEVAGVRMRAPMMRIHTVAAGGGSILTFDGSRFRVGPRSTGADPGPACYRKGGRLAVTDCNVMVGKILPAFFPHVFGPEGNRPLDAEVVSGKFEELSREVEAQTGDRRTREEVAEGFLKIAVDNMANAIKKISVQRGYDVSAYTLCCFGGAGGQHACRVADALGMTRVFIHPFAGVLSAYGMGLAEVRAIRERAVEARLDDRLVERLKALLDELAGEARAEIEGQGVAADATRVLRKVHLRYEGTDSPLVVDFADREAVIAAFETAHRRRYGFIDPMKAHIVEAVAAEAIGTTDRVEDPVLPRPGPDHRPEPAARTRMYTGGAFHDTPVFESEGMRPGDRVKGPAIIIEANATTVVEPGWEAEITERNHLLLTRLERGHRGRKVDAEVDPVMLEIFNNLYMSIAEQMGAVLENTAHSVNIKERLDFSCAVFDGEGHLVANAPHIPVHLGAMGESVRTIIEARQETVKPGDVFMLNAPYNGGTHLPDVTVITPVFGKDREEPLFYVASRGHHADIGGITPGSMPPNSRTVIEEGVLIDNFQLVDRGRFLEEEVHRLLTSGPYPARNPRQNIADLKAQVAACEKGGQEIKKMVRHFGLETVRAYMVHVRDNAEESVRRVLDVLKDGRFVNFLDDGSVIKVAISIDYEARRACIDFAGTSPQQEGNFNAPASVCKAAVLYVFRTLVDDDIPLNDGCLEPLEVAIPEGCMLDPRYPAAVVAGNVETSQIITDTLYGALGIMAAAQGTMNNFTFGNDRWQYYETICGGSGAGPDFDGADAVHTHMTNTRLTDPEVLEWRFPVIVERFAIRRGSGGAGRHRGGDGVVRRIRFRARMTAAILSSHRRVAPFGLGGGKPGALGRNWVERADGTRVELKGQDQTTVEPGDVFVIETPGGGGYGAPDGARP